MTIFPFPLSVALTSTAEKVGVCPGTGDISLRGFFSRTWGSSTDADSEPFALNLQSSADRFSSVTCFSGNGVKMIPGTAMVKRPCACAYSFGQFVTSSAAKQK